MTTGGQDYSSDVTVINTVNILGTVVISGTVTISGTVSVSGTVTVSGSVTVTNTVTVTGAVTVTGTVSITGSVTVTGTVAISGSVTVTGSVTVSGTVSISGSVTVTGSVTVSGTVAISGTVTISGSVSISGSVTITGAVTISSGTVTVTISAQSLSVLEVRTDLGGAGFKGITRFLPGAWAATNVTVSEGAACNLAQASPGQEVSVQAKEGFLGGIWCMQYLKTGVHMGAGVREFFGFGHVYDPNYVLFDLQPTAFYARTSKGGTGTYTDITASLPADYDDAWHAYKIVWTAASCKYYIDGTLAATITTNIPDIALEPMMDNLNNVAGTSVTLYLLGPSICMVSPLGDSVLGNLKMDVVAQTVGNLGIDIKAQTVGNLDINVAAQDADLDININAQALDITILAPSGKMVSTGNTVASNSMVTDDAFSGGTERQIISVSGRGKLSFVGFWALSSASTEPVEDTILRIYIDGALKFAASYLQIDMALNGGNLMTQNAAVATKYRATVINPMGGLTYGKTCSDVADDWEYVGGFLNIPFEYTTSFQVKVYNATKSGFSTMCILYGVYV